MVDDLYREVILDHYKNPRGHGVIEGADASEIADLPKEDLLEEIGIPLTPIRLKCALLGLGVLKVALHRSKGTPLPEEWAGLDELELK
jgi:NifU-like protein involved in Fe-S cluster formation